MTCTLSVDLTNAYNKAFAEALSKVDIQSDRHNEQLTELMAEATDDLIDEFEGADQDVVSKILNELNERVFTYV